VPLVQTGIPSVRGRQTHAHTFFTRSDTIRTWRLAVASNFSVLARNT
jgi:hypothetical protein